MFFRFLCWSIMIIVSAWSCCSWTSIYLDFCSSYWVNWTFVSKCCNVHSKGLLIIPNFDNLRKLIANVLHLCQILWLGNHINYAWSVAFGYYGYSFSLLNEGYKIQLSSRIWVQVLWVMTSSEAFGSCFDTLITQISRKYSVGNNSTFRKFLNSTMNYYESSD